MKYSHELQTILKYASEEAVKTNNNTICLDHLYLGMIRHSSSYGYEDLNKLNVDFKSLKTRINTYLYKEEKITFNDIEKIEMSNEVQELISDMEILAIEYHAEKINSHYLLYLLIKNKKCYGTKYILQNIDKNIDVINFLLDRIKFNSIIKDNTENQDYTNHEHNLSNQFPTEDDVIKNITSSLKNLFGDGIEDSIIVNEENKKKHQKITQITLNPKINKPENSLDKFCINLTELAKNNKLQGVFYRDNEIEQIIQILHRKKKNNVLIIGEPGVGKNAIVEGLAIKIAKGDVPNSMKDKEIWALNTTTLIAGANLFGELEERINFIIKELTEKHNIILFIDEIHTIVGGNQQNKDISSCLKPALTNGDFQCIGVTGNQEYHKSIEKITSLNNRFQKIEVKPFNNNQCLQILDAIKKEYEDFHHIKYSNEALEACISLADRYISDRNFPDKAIDVLDTVGAYVHLNDNNKDKVVRKEDIENIISNICGVDANKIKQSEAKLLLDLHKIIKEKVIGQDIAVESISNAILRGKAGLKDPERPIATFLFLGPTGVGKTHLSKCIAKTLFDTESNFLKIDMSEYLEKHSVAKFIGAPAGYIGYEEGGIITEWVKHHPHSVILLDEIEKAHESLYNILLQILDEGRITDNSGKSVDLRNTIIIMTSNVGSKDIKEYGKGIGFNTTQFDSDSIKENIIKKALDRYFPPEFINRIDDIIYFRSLGKNDMSKIFNLEINKINNLCQDNGYSIRISPKAKQFIIEKGFDINFGARNLKRSLIKYVQTPISQYIIKQKNNILSNNKVKMLYLDLDKSKTNIVVISDKKRNIKSN